MKGGEIRKTLNSLYRAIGMEASGPSRLLTDRRTEVNMKDLLFHDEFAPNKADEILATFIPASILPIPVMRYRGSKEHRKMKAREYRKTQAYRDWYKRCKNKKIREGTVI